jgi:hypothetical protein
MVIKVINKINYYSLLTMKAAVFERPGLDNLRIADNADLPKISDHDILIKVNLHIHTGLQI